jgi:hypothetical protein
MAHRAPATQKKVAYLGFQCLDHPPYSPDLAPSDYHLFSGLKKKLKWNYVGLRIYQKACEILRCIIPVVLFMQKKEGSLVSQNTSVYMLLYLLLG